MSHVLAASPASASASRKQSAVGSASSSRQPAAGSGSSSSQQRSQLPATRRTGAKRKAREARGAVAVATVETRNARRETRETRGAGPAVAGWLLVSLDPDRRSEIGAPLIGR
jgi:hypothetical protein